MDIVTGKPGAGKTLLAVKMIVDEYFYWHKKNKEFYRNDKNKKYVIFTNIVGFKLPHKNLDEIFEDIPFDQFFSYDYQVKIHEKYPHILYIIDEVHDFIPPRYNNIQVMKYFSKHRQLGDRVYLITQDTELTYKKLVKLCELEYRAVPKTFKLPGTYTYNLKAKGMIVKRKMFREDKRLYKLYKSFSNDNMIQHFNPLKIIIPLLIIGFLICGYFFFQFLNPDSDEKPLTPKLPPKKAITEFRKIAPIEPIKTPEPSPEETNLKQFHAIEILSKVIRKERLYAFEDPITTRWYYNFENPYHVEKVGHKYYIIISGQMFQKVQNQAKMLSSSSS